MSLKPLGALPLCLIMCACASTELRANVQTQEVKVPTEQLTIDPALLVIQPLTPLPTARDGDALLETVTIIHDDHQRDRGHLRELIGAEKQREHSQKQINAAASEAAAIRRAAIDAANKETTTVRKPLWKRLF